MKIWCGLIGVLVVGFLLVTPQAQSFSSGSDGSDGALTLTGGDVFFDPFDTARWGKVLDPDGDGVYNFTTISIAGNLRFRSDFVNRPVYFLASGAVTFSGGSLILDGQDGPVSSGSIAARRVLGIPGSGGWAGGAGGTTVGSIISTPGEGPGGGVGGAGACLGSGWLCGKGGTFSGNRFLVPLVGGSGGEGSVYKQDSTIGWGGGAGGGAILIASSTSITLNGSIRSLGGGGGSVAGGGSGGAIRLVAPRISGNGFFNVNGGETGRANAGSSGLVRLEAFDIPAANINFTPSSTLIVGWPGAPSTLRPTSSVRVTSIDGIPIAADPRGSFQIPDVTLGKQTPVNVSIQATGVPPGTVVTLQVYPQTLQILADPTGLTLYLTAQGALAGTLQSSSVTIPMTFPFGASRGFVRANW